MNTLSTTRDEILQLIGMLDAMTVAFPPTNADGTINQAAQDQAVTDFVTNAVTNQVFTLPAGMSTQAGVTLSLTLVKTFQSYKAATKKATL